METIMRIRSNVRCAIIFSVLALAVAGCSGGSATSTPAGEGSPLAITEKVSVVDALDQESEPEAFALGAPKAASLSIEPLIIDPGGFSVDSAYNTDDVDIWVQERSIEAFSIVNEILCMVGQTGYQDMINQGPYKALVDMDQCESMDDASEAGAESQIQGADEAPEYMFWTVDSYRADDHSPHIVKAWIHEEGDEWEPAKVINVRTIITEAVSETNPYGMFTMYFKGVPEGGGAIMFRGLLRTEIDGSGNVLLKFVDQGGFSDQYGDFFWTEAVTLDRAADGSTGGGSLYTEDTSPFGSRIDEFDISYDMDNFLREDANTGDSVCLDRNEFEESVWRYGLYDSSGDRVNRDSGFPIMYDDGSHEYHGWIGYYGLWFPEGVQIEHGDSVTKFEYGPESDTGEEYNVFVAGGKLVRHSRQEITLGDIVNVPLEQWEYDEDTQTDYNYLVTWDGSDFVRTAWKNESTDWIWQEMTPEILDLSAMQYPELYMWSQAVGGDVQLKLQDCVFDDNQTPYDWMDDTYSCNASNASPTIVYTQETMFPEDSIPSSLVCLEGCPDPNFLDSSNPWAVNVHSWQGTNPANATYMEYTFDSTSMTLSSNGLPVVLDTVNSFYQWGIHSGPLFEATFENLDALTCDYDSSATCGWQAHSNLTVYYTWETGIQEWNRFTALQDPLDQSFITFEAPLMVEYVHSQPVYDAPDHKYNGVKFLLDYNGFGDLHGIPGKCVDEDTGEHVSCDENTRWVPEFNIPDGTTLVSLEDGATEYLVKGLEREQRMKEDTSLGACSGLSTSTYVLPEITEWEDPAIGPEPEISGPPSVIAGEVQ